MSFTANEVEKIENEWEIENGIVCEYSDDDFVVEEDSETKGEAEHHGNELENEVGEVEAEEDGIEW